MNNDIKKILVVDDDKVTTELSRTFLKNDGFAVVTADDGESALDIALEEQPDLIILDVKLPTIDGFEVCRELRSHYTFKSTPILMLTARGLSNDLERCEEVGVDEYIVKPFSGRALGETVRKHLQMGE